MYYGANIVSLVHVRYFTGIKVFILFYVTDIFSCVKCEKYIVKTYLFRNFKGKYVSKFKSYFKNKGELDNRRLHTDLFVYIKIKL